MKKGFTLVEIIVVIAVITILAALIIPVMYRSTEQKKYERAASDLEAIYKAIFGDGENDFGYHGDMGNIPPDLRCLAVPSSDSCDRPSPQEWPSGSGVIIGWKGPYYSPAKVDSNGYFLDPWGNPYQMTPLTGSSLQWQLASAGPDGQIDWSIPQGQGVNQDNLYYPESPIIVTDSDGDGFYIAANSVGFSSIIGKIENFRYVNYRMYYPVNGNGTYTDGGYQTRTLSNVPYGKRVFQGIIYTCGGLKYGKYYTRAVPLSGEIAISMDLTTDSSGAMVDSIYWYRVINHTWWWAAQGIEIRARSALNCSPTSSGYYQNGVSMEVLGIGNMRWNSTNNYFRLFLPSPPYTPTSTYNFTIHSSGGGSRVVSN